MQFEDGKVGALVGHRSGSVACTTSDAETGVVSSSRECHGAQADMAVPSSQDTRETLPPNLLTEVDRIDSRSRSPIAVVEA